MLIGTSREEGIVIITTSGDENDHLQVAVPHGGGDNDIILEKVGPKKIQLIKALREMMNNGPERIGLKEAKAFVDSVPVPLAFNIGAHTSHPVIQKVAAAGGEVSVIPSLGAGGELRFWEALHAALYTNGCNVSHSVFQHALDTALEDTKLTLHSDNGPLPNSHHPVMRVLQSTDARFVIGVKENGTAVLYDVHGEAAFLDRLAEFKIAEFEVDGKHVLGVDGRGEPVLLGTKKQEESP